MYIYNSNYNLIFSNSIFGFNRAEIVSNINVNTFFNIKIYFSNQYGGAIYGGNENKKIMFETTLFINNQAKYVIIILN